MNRRACWQRAQRWLRCWAFATETAALNFAGNGVNDGMAAGGRRRTSNVARGGAGITNSVWANRRSRSQLKVENGKKGRKKGENMSYNEERMTSMKADQLKASKAA